ncbi:MAG: hypothetical protein P8181_03855 [bacterium]
MVREPSESNVHATPFSHAESTLEFGSVLDLIASKCVNRGAAAEVRALHPTTDLQWIRTRLSEIEEAVEYQSARGRLPIVDTGAGSWVELAVEKHETIAPEGCIAVAAMERAVNELKLKMMDEAEFPMLRGIIGGMTPHTDLVSMIENAVERDGTIKDSASPALKNLRRRIRDSRGDLRQYSEKLARSFGSDDIATFTGTRHVLLVPRDKARRSEGLVHSASHSGESLYFEPFPLVEKNNALETLIHDERVETARILSALTAAIVASAPGLTDNIRVWERLDALSAKARFAAEFGCRPPILPSDESTAAPRTGGAPRAHPPRSRDGRPVHGDGDHRTQCRGQDGHAQDRGACRSHVSIGTSRPGRGGDRASDFSIGLCGYR